MDVGDEYRTMKEDSPLPEKYLISSKQYRLDNDPSWLHNDDDDDDNDDTGTPPVFSPLIARRPTPSPPVSRRTPPVTRRGPVLSPLVPRRPVLLSPAGGGSLSGEVEAWCRELRAERRWSLPGDAPSGKSGVSSQDTIPTAHVQPSVSNTMHTGDTNMLPTSGSNSTVHSSDEPKLASSTGSDNSRSVGSHLIQLHGTNMPESTGSMPSIPHLAATAGSRPSVPNLPTSQISTAFGQSLQGLNAQEQTNFRVPSQHSNFALDKSNFVSDSYDGEGFRPLPSKSPGRLPSSHSASDFKNLVNTNSHAHPLQRNPSKSGHRIGTRLSGDRVMSSKTSFGKIPSELPSRDRLKTQARREMNLYNWDTATTDSSAEQTDSSCCSSESCTSTNTDSSDIYLWRQRQKENLKKQNVEITTSSTASLSKIQQAAEEIVREKDSVIDRQRMKISEMEMLVGDRQAFDSRFRELQYENSKLKARMAELSNKSGDQSALQKKLGAAEYELETLKSELEKKDMNKSDTIKNLTSKVGEKEKQIMTLTAELENCKREQTDLMKKLRSQQRYMNDLPTADQFTSEQKKIKAMQEEKSKYKQMTAEMEKRLADATRAIVSRDGHIEMLEQSDRKLKARISALEEEVAGVNKKLTSAQEANTADGIQDSQELQQKNAKLVLELEKAKKLLETVQRQQQQTQARHLSRVAELEERITHESATLSALRSEVEAGTGQVLKHRNSATQLNSQKQELEEKCHMLEDKLRDYEQKFTPDAQKLERRFLREMTICLGELQSLVEICVERSEGKNPNVSSLLGVKDEGSWQELVPQEEYNTQSLQVKIRTVNNLRSQVDRLREIISNKFAEDMGENLNCTTH